MPRVPAGAPYAVAASESAALKGILAEAGGVVLADSDTNRIWQVPRAGGPGTQIAGLVPASGDEPVAPGKLGLNRPSALAIDGQGNLYVADANNAIRRISSAGLVTTLAGNNQSGFQ